jgi:hypothetical protein
MCSARMIWPAEHKKAVKTHCARGKKLLARYRRAITKGQSAEFAALGDLLNSYAFKVFAAYEANRKLSPLRRRIPLQLLVTAKQLFWDTPLTRKEQLIVKPKSSGSVRAFYDFGFERRTIFEGLTQILRQHLALRPFQYDHKGLAAAIKAVRARIEKGHVHVRHVDIRNHYASFVAEKLVDELPLPTGVVDRWVMASCIPIGEIVKRGRNILGSNTDLRSVAHQGIPLGSALSSTIALLIGSKLAWKTPAGAFLVNIADNYLIMAKSKSVADKAGSALVSAVEALPGGHFTLKSKLGDYANDGFAFLGHWIRLCDGKVKIHPTPTNEDRFFNRLRKLDKLLWKCLTGPEKDDPEVVELAHATAGRMWVYARSWIAAFSACDDIGSYLEPIAITMKPMIAKLGISVADLDKYESLEASWTFAELS